jgi:hypothetical protein
MTLVFTFVFMLALIAAMAVGVLMGRKPIAGSCGGLRNMGMDVECEICGGDTARCRESEGGPGQRL